MLVKPWPIGTPVPSHLVDLWDLDLLTTALKLPALSLRFGQSPLPPSVLLPRPLGTKDFRLLAPCPVHLQPLAQLLPIPCLLLQPAALLSWEVPCPSLHPCPGPFDHLISLLL